MNLVKLIEFLRNHLKTVVRLCCVVLALVVVLAAIPGIVDKQEAHTGIEDWPGFWAVFGFVGCVLIIIVSKWFGHAGIMTREDYYDE
jgi:TRAP-type C4-dicarboxylate transport system permease small subunit